MNITFYFDPSCPFSWITSRWLLMVSGERDLDVTWKPFCLALKNEKLDESKDPYRKIHEGSKRLLRVMAAAEAKNGGSLIDMYKSAGIKFHIGKEPFDDELINGVLSENKLPAGLIEFADKQDFDHQLRDSIKSATEIAGEDVGVPTIIFTNEKGDQQGFFGPVLQELPDKKESLELWDGLSKLATNSNFYELKRSRPSGNPDVYSTAKC